MRQHLQRPELFLVVWSVAVGAFACLAGLALGVTGTTALVAGATAGTAVFLFVRLYSLRVANRP